MLVLCPKCKVEFDDSSKWGPKKFCSRKCANSRTWSSEVNAQRSTKLLRRLKSTPVDTPNLCAFGCKDQAKYMNIKGLLVCEEKDSLCPSKKRAKSYKPKTPKSLLDMSKRTTQKLVKRMNLSCFECGWNKATCDLHHIKPRGKSGGDTNDNLTLLCPNCHRMAHHGLIEKFVSVKEKLGDSWRDFYYSHA